VVQHRYYGESLPLGKKGSLTQEGLQFLSIEQALSDYIILIQVRDLFELAGWVRMGHGLVSQRAYHLKGARCHDVDLCSLGLLESPAPPSNDIPGTLPLHAARNEGVGRSAIPCGGLWRELRRSPGSFLAHEVAPVLAAHGSTIGGRNPPPRS
jgi:hypothetical protein